MSKKYNILIISDDENYISQFKEKLIFLRENDSLEIIDFESVHKFLKSCSAEIILVHENSSKSATLNTITSIADNENLSVILLVNAYDTDFILSAYDCGIKDFISADADDFELVIRTVSNIRQNSVKKLMCRNIRLLEQLNVIDDLTGLYNYNFARQVIENTIDDNLIDDGTFMAIAPCEDSKPSFSVEKFAQTVFTSIRSDDVATLGRGARFYILLPNTGFNGAVCVLNKIKDNYPEKHFDICAGITTVAHKNFDEMEDKALKALSDALATNAQYSCSEEKEETLDDWLDDGINEHKNYKIFRQIFNKKMEKVITPVFYRLQKAWEEKLFKTRIDQYTDKEQCVFHLKNKNQDSTLRIVYPGFAKIVIYITHEGLDSPENKEIQLQLTKISKKELEKIVEDFIRDFKYTSV